MCVRMPFGKYAGCEVQDIPSGYLRWLLREVRDLALDIRREGQRVLCVRGDAEPEPTPQLPDVRPVIKSWYREMAKKYHPDRTLDDGAAMSAINYGYERLQELLGIER